MGDPAGGAKMSQAALSDLEQRMVDCIEQYGCFVMSVFGPEKELADFAYSIGFPASFGQGDVLISGLDLDLMKTLINDTCRLCSEGLVLSDFGRTDQLLNNYDCAFRAVAPENLVAEYWNSARWFQERYREQPFSGAYQIVWPDKAGAFPWEEGFDDRSGGGQLQLWQGATIQ